MTTTINNDDDRYQRGLKKIKRIYKHYWDEKVFDDISPEFGAYMVDFLYDDVYDENKMDAKLREIAIIS